jgi:CHAD domain-containing protein
MTFRIIKQNDMGDNIRLVARDQIDKALTELADTTLGAHEVVHQVRKRCKKIRGLIRLVRPVFSAYPMENVLFRDAARGLSRIRDAQAVIDTHDSLIDHFSGHLETGAFSSVREYLGERRDEIVRTDLPPEALWEFSSKMREARQRSDDWRIETGGFDAVQGGLGKTYGRARKALSRAGDHPCVEHIHEARKRVKYHWYHVRLLRDIWPDMMKMRGAELHRLSELLGMDHDLWVLQQALASYGISSARSNELQVLLGLADQRSAELRAEARPLGVRLMAAKPKWLIASFRSYWSVWRDR